MITECTHEVDEKGYYNGKFIAIAADTGYLPRPEFTSPTAESQLAKVISNSDPLNQGPVQVRFDWQLHDTTELIRVMTPDARGSGKVTNNRAFMAIPEVGDQVMVDFIHDNPDRPFVMGGMFTGTVGRGGGAGNNVKSLSSKSGNKLELHDGEGSVYLTDQGDANMKFDGAGNAAVNTNANHTTTAGQNHITTAGSTKVINVGKGSESLLKMDAGGNISLTCNTNITLTTGASSITMKSDGTIILKGKIIGIGTETAMIVASKSSHFNSKETKIDGGDVFIN